MGLLLGLLLIGMAGWVQLLRRSGLAWGPVDAARTDGEKVFAGLYALYAGLIFILAAGLVFVPVLHRLLHKFHCDENQ